MKHILYDVGKVLVAGPRRGGGGAKFFLLVHFMCRCIILYPQNLKLYQPLPTMNIYRFLRKNEVFRGRRRKKLDFKTCFKALRSQKKNKIFHILRCPNFSRGGFGGWDNVPSLAVFVFLMAPLREYF